jgi:hypothetical protein
MRRTCLISVTFDCPLTPGLGYFNCCRASARQHTILDVLAFSCPVPAAELCIVEWRFLVGGDFGIPGGSLSIQVRL